MVVAPELADVLAAIVHRIRDDHGAVPLVVAYDLHERIWNPPMPLLFQKRVGIENRPISIEFIRRMLKQMLTGLTDGKPITFLPHDLGA